MFTLVCVGVSVTLICPGPVESEIASNSFSGVQGQKGQTGEANQKVRTEDGMRMRMGMAADGREGDEMGADGMMAWKIDLISGMCAAGVL